MTRPNDVWVCSKCGEAQGRHDMWFEDDLCGACDDVEFLKNTPDLFLFIDTLPKRVQKILWEYAWEEKSYEACERMLADLESEGYTFEFGLDAEPFNLTKIK